MSGTSFSLCSADKVSEGEESGARVGRAGWGRKAGVAVWGGGLTGARLLTLPACSILTHGSSLPLPPLCLLDVPPYSATPLPPCRLPCPQPSRLLYPPSSPTHPPPEAPLARACPALTRSARTDPCHSPTHQQQGGGMWLYDSKATVSGTSFSSCSADEVSEGEESGARVGRGGWGGKGAERRSGGVTGARLLTLPCLLHLDPWLISGHPPVSPHEPPCSAAPLPTCRLPCPHPPRPLPLALVTRTPTTRSATRTSLPSPHTFGPD